MQLVFKRPSVKKKIFILVAHQSEDYMPMTLACMKAAKKLIMEDLEKPDLIVLDGGELQVKVVVDILNELKESQTLVDETDKVVYFNKLSDAE